MFAGWRHVAGVSRSLEADWIELNSRGSPSGGEAEVDSVDNCDELPIGSVVVRDDLTSPRFSSQGLGVGVGGSGQGEGVGWGSGQKNGWVPAGQRYDLQ